MVWFSVISDMTLLVGTEFATHPSIGLQNPGSWHLF